VLCRPPREVGNSTHSCIRQIYCTTRRSKRLALYDMEKIKIALQIKGLDGTRLMGPQLWGDDPKRVSDIITRKMKEILNRRDMGVALGTFISSHSWRKCGASAAARLQIDWHTIMCWGMWISHASAEKYVDHKYTAVCGIAF
jgi:hypothetical protein